MSAKAGLPDPVGILEAITKLRFAADSPVGAALLEHAPFDPIEHPTTKAVAQSYIRCIEAGDKHTARSMLSVLVTSCDLTESQVISLCSHRNAVAVGDVVLVTGSGGTRTKMKVAAIHGDTTFLHPIESGDGADASPVEVSIAQCRSLNDVQCTSHQIRQAKIHALKKFSGAKFCPVITRTGGIDPVRAKYVAEFLRDPTVVEVVEATVAKARKVK